MYRSAVDEELDRLRRNKPPVYLPQVLRIADTDSWGGLTHLPTIIAAIERSREDDRCVITVVELAALNGAAFPDRAVGRPARHHVL